MTGIAREARVRKPLKVKSLRISRGKKQKMTRLSHRFDPPLHPRFKRRWGAFNI